jgi:ATP-dependent RNA helicase RhlE
MSFESLGLSAALVSAVSAKGYSEPTAVQRAAIPAILTGGDLMASAQTGTGKTAGFALPILQRLTTASPQKGQRTLRALILTPTRELAAQVQDSFRSYGRHLPLKSAAVFGGMSINPQISALRRGVDILVATPGRLLDHVEQRTVDLSRIEVLVLDEADRMLDMGFVRDIRRILALLPARRQNLLFSATFADGIRDLAQGMLRAPARIDTAPKHTAAETVRQVVHPVDTSRKRELLSHLIASGNWRQVLVFTRTKHGADRLAKQLGQDGLHATAIHGNKNQNARTRALSDFKQGRVRILVATDVAARGLDIDQLPHVVNYDMSQVPEDYVHRIGRTGRAGREGEAVSLVSPEEQGLLRGIEKLLGFQITRSVIDGFASRASVSGAPTARFDSRVRANNGRPTHSPRWSSTRRERSKGQPTSKVGT